MYLFCFSFKASDSLVSTSLLGTHYLDQTGLELTERPTGLSPGINGPPWPAPSQFYVLDVDFYFNLKYLLF